MSDGVQTRVGSLASLRDALLRFGNERSTTIEEVAYRTARLSDAIDDAAGVATLRRERADAALAECLRAQLAAAQMGTSGPDCSWAQAEFEEASRRESELYRAQTSLRSAIDTYGFEAREMEVAIRDDLDRAAGHLRNLTANADAVLETRVPTAKTGIGPATGKRTRGGSGEQGSNPEPDGSPERGY